MCMIGAGASNNEPIKSIYTWSQVIDIQGVNDVIFPLIEVEKNSWSKQWKIGVAEELPRATW